MTSQPKKKGVALASIGIAMPPHASENLKWKDVRTLADFEVVIAKPHFGDFTFDSGTDYDGSKARSAQLQAYFATQHWPGEIAPFLRGGKTLIVLLGIPYFYTLNVERGPSSLRPWDLAGLPLYDVANLTVRKPKLTKRGAQILGNHAELTGRFDIVTTFKLAGATPLLTTDDDSDRWLAAELRVGPGRVVILPQTVLWHVALTALPQNELQKSVQAERAALCRFALDSVDDVSKAEAPPWSAGQEWHTAREKEASESITVLESEIQVLRSREEALATEGEALRSMRALLYANGSELENVVRAALRKLGLPAEPFDDGKLRIDARFEHEGTTYVCEIEGKDNKPIDITKYRQLMDMCLGEQERAGAPVEVRGILFGNGFRVKAPADRGPEFTDQVVTTATRQGVLLVSTTDLYRAWMDEADGYPTGPAALLKAAIIGNGGGIFGKPA